MNIKKLMGSDRPGHLFAACVVGLTLALIGHSIASPWLIGVGGVVVAWEWLATPDVDLAWKRRPNGLLWKFVCALWWPYSKVVPHRSKYSHSLRYGLPLRLFYVALLVLIPCELLQLPLWEWMILDARLLLHDGQWIPAIALLWQRWSMVLIGCIVADVTHLLKDGYGAGDMLLGR